MKKLTITVNSTIKERIWWKLFNLYLFLSKFGEADTNKQRHYDHLGEIDTLGWDSENTRFTFHYSEEMGSLYRIKLPFKYVIELNNYFEKEILIYKLTNN